MKEEIKNLTRMQVLIRDVSISKRESSEAGNFYALSISKINNPYSSKTEWLQSNTGINHCREQDLKVKHYQELPIHRMLLKKGNIACLETYRLDSPLVN